MFEEVGGIGGYVEQSGNIGEGRAVQACSTLVGGDSGDIWILGGSLYVLADFLSAERNVVCMHPDPRILQKIRRELGQLLYDDDLVARRFRAECRSFGDDMRNLVKDALAVIAMGVLHHVANPRVVLSRWLQTGKPLVVLDTTSELAAKAAIEYSRQHRRVADGHLFCKDEAVRAGLNREENIHALLEESCVQDPDFFQYVLTCGWCRQAPCNSPSGVFAWMAKWRGVGA